MVLRCLVFPVQNRKVGLSSAKTTPIAGTHISKILTTCFHICQYIFQLHQTFCITLTDLATNTIVGNTNSVNGNTFRVVQYYGRYS